MNKTPSKVRGNFSGVVGERVVSQPDKPVERERFAVR